MALPQGGKRGDQSIGMFHYVGVQKQISATRLTRSLRENAMCSPEIKIAVLLLEERGRGLRKSRAYQKFSLPRFKGYARKKLPHSGGWQISEGVEGRRACLEMKHFVAFLLERKKQSVMLKAHRSRQEAAVQLGAADALILKAPRMQRWSRETLRGAGNGVRGEKGRDARAG